MMRLLIISIAALSVFTASAWAQSMDCNGLYKAALEKILKEEIGGLETTKLAELHRLALRAYDACSAGDEFNARAFFDELDRHRR